MTSVLLSFWSGWWAAYLLWHPIAPLVDQRATEETKQLYKQLHWLQAHTLLVGHQNAYIQGVHWRIPKQPQGTPDFTQVSGRPPAIVGFDFGNFKDTDSLPFEGFLKQVKRAHSKGAIITFSWHMYHPITGRKPHPKDQTSADPVQAILPGGSAHKRYKESLDHIARFVRRAKDQKNKEIPIIFRPFHEQNGDWFWWSRTTAARYIKLWQWTVRYLRDTKKLHQLLYAFSPSAQYDKRQRRSYLSWYPGDKYVDIFGLDCYADQIERCLPRLRELVVLARTKGKLAALTETGWQHPESPVASKAWTKHFLQPLWRDPLTRHLSYAMFWRNANRFHHYVPYVPQGYLPIPPSARNFRKMLQHPWIFDANELRRFQRHQPITPAPPFHVPQQAIGFLFQDAQWHPWWLSFQGRTISLKRLKGRYQAGRFTATQWTGGGQIHLAGAKREGQLQWEPGGIGHKSTQRLPPITSRPSMWTWTPKGTEHLLYRSRQELILLTKRLTLPGFSLRQPRQEPAPHWRALSLSKQLPQAPKIQGAPFGWSETGSLTLHTVAQGIDRHLYDFRYSLRQRRWSLHQLTRGSPQHTLPTGSWQLSREGRSRSILYLGKGGILYELRSPSSRQSREWSHINVHTESGWPPRATGTPCVWSGKVTDGASRMIAYRGGKGRIHLLSKVAKGRWQHREFNTGPRAISDPVCFTWTSVGSIHILFQDGRGRLQELWSESGRWTQQALSGGLWIPQMRRGLTPLRPWSSSSF